MPSTPFERTAATLNLQARKRAQAAAWHAAFEQAIQAGQSGSEAMRAADAAAARIVAGSPEVVERLDASSKLSEVGSEL